MSMFLIDKDDAIEQDTLEISASPKTASGCVHSYEL